MVEDKSKKNEAYRIAEADSKDCEDCNGDGMATVYAPGYDGSSLRRDNLGRTFVARTVAHCRCPLGRHLRASSPEDVNRRTPEVANILAGHSNWSLDDPTEKPVNDPGRPVTKEDFDAFWRMLTNRPMLKETNGDATVKQPAWSLQTAYRKRLARDLGLDDRIADVLTIDELMTITKTRGTQ